MAKRREIRELKFAKCEPLNESLTGLVSNNDHTVRSPYDLTLEKMPPLHDQRILVRF